MRKTRRLRILLDSNALLWWLQQSARLSSDGYAAIADPDNHIAVSAASAWEIEIKRSAGKLRAPLDLREQIDAEGFEPLFVTIQHAVAAGRLPQHHGDPFDRMLVAQAQIEGLTLLTSDPTFGRYGVPVLDAWR